MGLFSLTRAKESGLNYEEDAVKVGELKKVISGLSDEAEVPIRGGKCEVRYLCYQGTAGTPEALYLDMATVIEKINRAAVAGNINLGKTKMEIFRRRFERTRPVIAVLPNGNGASKR